jgi:hypothetical protein
MAQDFSMRYPIVDSRATSGRSTATSGGDAVPKHASNPADDMMADLDGPVDFVQNYDGQLKSRPFCRRRFPISSSRLGRHGSAWRPVRRTICARSSTVHLAHREHAPQGGQNRVRADKIKNPQI